MRVAWPEELGSNIQDWNGAKLKVIKLKNLAVKDLKSFKPGFKPWLSQVSILQLRFVAPPFSWSAVQIEWNEA